MIHIKRIDEMVSQPYANYDDLPRNFMCGDVEFEKSEDLDTFDAWYGAWDVQMPNIAGKHHLCVRVVKAGNPALWMGEVDSKALVDRTGKPVVFGTPEEMANALMLARENELRNN